MDTNQTLPNEREREQKADRLVMNIENRVRRERGSETHILNTPISTKAYRLLKEESVKRRIAIGVIIDELVDTAERRRLKASNSAQISAAGLSCSSSLQLSRRHY